MQHVALIAAAVVAGQVVIADAPAAVAASAGVAGYGLLFGTRQPQLWVAGMAFVMAWAALPAFVPQEVEVAGFATHISDLLFPVAAALVLLGFRQRARGADGAAALLAAVLAFGAVRSLMAGVELNWVWRDLRGPASMLAAYVIVSRLTLAGHEHAMWRFACWLVGVSGALTMAASVRLVALGGTSDAVATARGYTAFEGVSRFQTPAIHFALALLCGVAAYGLRGRLPRSAWWAGAAAAAVVFLGFSRNSVVAVLIALLVGVLLHRSAKAPVRLAVGATLLALVLVGASVAGHLLSIPGSGVVRNQVDAFQTRVLTGLSSDFRRRDTSLALRRVEGSYAGAAWRDRPVVGHGLGASYRPRVGGQTAFLESEEGRRYIHNGYLWLAVKTGGIGVLAFLTWVAAALFQATRHRSPVGVAVFASLIAMLAVMTIAPLPISASGAPVLGALLGLAAAAQRFSGVAERPAALATGSKATR